MQKKSLFKKVLSGALAFTLAIGSMLTTPLTAEAVESTATDGTVTGSGSYSAASGYWITDYSNPTIYRCYPILLVDNLDSVASNSTVTISYENQYYYFRDLALYTTSTDKATEAYYFSGTTTRGANTIAGMTLNSNGTYDFSTLGVSLNLPTHTFDISKSEYVSFSDELNSKIITEGDNQNIKTIFYNYLTEVNGRKDSLGEKGKSRLEILNQLTGYGTDNFDNYCKNFGFVFELCSTATNRSDGHQYVLSYGDMVKGAKIGDDPYYIYKVFNEAAESNSLLTWSARYNEKSISIIPEEALGEVVYFFCNTKSSTDSVTQALNITLSYDGELKANTNSTDIKKSWNAVTSVKNPNLDLGSTTYTKVLDNAFENSLADTSISLNNGGTLNTSNESSTLQTLSGRSDYSGLDLNKYDVLKVAIDASSYSLSDINNIDITSALKGISAKTKANVVSNGFGNTYTLSFEGATTVRSNVANSVKAMNGVSSVSSYVSKTKDGTVSQMADLQGASILSGKIEGSAKDGGLSNAKGTTYVTISYLSKDKKVTSKEAEVYINKNAGVETVKSIDSKNYSVSDSVEWNVTGKSKSYTYAIAWRAGDYGLTDEKALTESILSALGDTYVLRGSSGASTLLNGFKEATGVQPLGVKYLKDSSSVKVGSSAKDDKSLTGINVLVVNVSQELPVNIKSEDLVDSNELNFVYPNLLGWKSTTNAIVPIAAYSNDIAYPYTVSDSNSGDLISFKGNNVHYYYEPTGLFGVFSQANKTFNATSYPSYAYNISRALWGDSLVASNYRGLSATDSSVQADIKNNLGLSIGATGNLSSVTCGENVDGTVNTTKEDKYKFTGSITLSDGSTCTEKNNYTITHSLNKYTCLALDTALNGNAGKAGFSIQNANGINNKVTMVTQSANTLTVYPEVAYKYYFADVSNGVLNNAKPLTVYVMGERARIMKPSSIRGIDMDYSIGATEVANGDVVSDGTLVGSDASSMSGGKQVIPQGTDITMKADHTVDYRLISYSLDVVDTYSGVSVRNEFSSENANYQPDKEHEDFVQEFIDNVQVNTYMNIGNKEYEMKTSNTVPRVNQSTSTTYLAIEFANGKIDENAKNSVINDIATEYGVSIEQATQIFESSGFEKQLQDMFESNTDSNNASKNKWYDEESVTLCIRKYITVVNLHQALVQDKIDYNVLGIVGREDNGQSINQTADAYFSMSVSLPEDFAGCDLTNANKLFEKQKIKGTEFKVSSSSTADFNK